MESIKCNGILLKEFKDDERKALFMCKPLERRNLLSYCSIGYFLSVAAATHILDHEKRCGNWAACTEVTESPLSAAAVDLLNFKAGCSVVGSAFYEVEYVRVMRLMIKFKEMKGPRLHGTQHLSGDNAEIPGIFSAWLSRTMKFFT